MKNHQNDDDIKKNCRCHIDIKISPQTEAELNKYAVFFDYSIGTVVKYLVLEHILYSEDYQSDEYTYKHKHCRPRKTKTRESDYSDLTSNEIMNDNGIISSNAYNGKEIQPKSIQIWVPKNTYEYLNIIRKSLNEKLNKYTWNVFINNIIHLELRRLPKSGWNAIDNASLKSKSSNTRFKLPNSSEFQQKLDNMASISGLTSNQLITFLIGKYLLENSYTIESKIIESEYF